MKRIIALLFLLSIFFACKKEKSPVEEPVIPSATTGALKGKVSQYDQYGTLYTSGLNTTTVTIDSIGISTTTDQNGQYMFTGISSGTYTLLFKKPVCGSVKIKKIDFKFSDTITYNTAIADMPSFSISNAYLKDTSWFSTPLPGIYYNATTSSSISKAGFVAIVGRSADISLANPLSYIKFLLPSVYGAADYNRFISYSFLSQSYGFEKDSLIYMKIYPVSAIGASYYDNDIKKPVYTAYGTPYPVLKVKMLQ